MAQRRSCRARRDDLSFIIDGNRPQRRGQRGINHRDNREVGGGGVEVAPDEHIALVEEKAERALAFGERRVGAEAERGVKVVRRRRRKDRVFALR